MAATTVMSAVDPLRSDRHIAPTSLSDDIVRMLGTSLPPGTAPGITIPPELTAQLLSAWGRTGRQRLERRLQERPSLQQTRKSSASAQTLPSPADSQKSRAPPSSHAEPHQSLRPARISDRVSKQRSPRASRMSAVTKPSAATKAHPGSSGVRTTPTPTANTDASAAERQYTQDLMGLGDRLTEKEPHVQSRRNKATAGSSLNFLAEGATESPFCTLTKPMTDEIDAFLDAKFGTDKTKGAGKDGYIGRTIYERHEYGIHNKLGHMCTADDAWLTRGGETAVKQKAMHMYERYKQDPSLVPDMTYCSPLLRCQQTTGPCREVHNMFAKDGEHPFMYLDALREQGGCVASSVATSPDNFDAPRLRGQSFAEDDSEWNSLFYEHGPQLDQRADLLEAIKLYTMDGIHARTGQEEVTLLFSGHANLGRHYVSKGLPESHLGGSELEGCVSPRLRNDQSTLLMFERKGLSGSNKTATPTDAEVLYVDKRARNDAIRVNFHKWLKKVKSERSEGQTTKTDTVVPDSGKAMDTFASPNGIAVA